MPPESRPPAPPTSAGLRTARRLVIGLSAAALAIGGCTWHIGSAFLPSAPATPAQDTTVVTLPVLPDGRIDYGAALNAEGSARVPPERNAAALLVQAFGPAAIADDFEAEYAAMLEIPELPEDGDYLVNQERFTAVLTTEPLSFGEAGETISELHSHRVQHALDYPWTREDMPEMAAWIDANQRPLDAIVAASALPDCYFPVRQGANVSPLLSQMMPLEGPLRETGRLLAIRANLRIAEGDPQAAWSDALAAHRLARQLSFVPFVISHLIAHGIDTHASIVDANLAKFAAPDVGQARRWCADLSALGPPPPGTTVVDRGERYSLLDTMQRLSVESRSATAAAVTVSRVPTGHIDWNESLRLVNAFCDRQVEVFDRSDLPTRLLGIEELDADVAGWRDQGKLGSPKLHVATVLFRRATATTSFTRAMIVHFSTPMKDVAVSDARALARYRLALLTFALAAHRAERDYYPTALNVLAPDYLPVIPLDPMVEQPFAYRRVEDGSYALYSVGENFQDDRGATYRSDPQRDDLSLP